MILRTSPPQLSFSSDDKDAHVDKKLSTPSSPTPKLHAIYGDISSNDEEECKSQHNFAFSRAALNDHDDDIKSRYKYDVDESKDNVKVSRIGDKVAVNGREPHGHDINRLNRNGVGKVGILLAAPVNGGVAFKTPKCANTEPVTVPRKPRILEA